MKDLKRRYNACYRLRKKLGVTVFPKRSRIIFSQDIEEVLNQSEAKILLKEYGFVIQPKLFT